MAKYILAYWYEWFGPCLWGRNDAAQEEFGYAIKPYQLPFSPELAHRMDEMIRWHDSLLNWENPGASPLLWNEEECLKFNRASQHLLADLRLELGADFEIIDEQEELHEDPELEAYLRDPEAWWQNKKRKNR